MRTRTGMNSTHKNTNKQIPTHPPILTHTYTHTRTHAHTHTDVRWVMLERKELIYIYTNELLHVYLAKE